MLRRRDQLAPRFGKWPATVIAAAAVLRRQRPLRLTIDGERVDLWSLFVGHCRYPARGPFPATRARSDDRLLEVQYLQVGALPDSSHAAWSSTAHPRTGRSRPP